MMADEEKYEEVFDDSRPALDGFADTEEALDSEGLKTLEDSPQDEQIGDASAIAGEDLAAVAQDTPIYRLRLVYSKETFCAVWEGGELEPGTKVIVPTRYGKDLAEVISIQHKAAHCPQAVTRIERLASSEDLVKAEGNTYLEKEAFHICRKKITDHKLDMKLVSVHYLMDEPKVLFFFTAENRVDFRELVKDLVSIFKTRIELRQIGVRDESRVLGGLGVCGRAYCCHSVSNKLKSVSIKMAKDQNLSLNSMKISGPCGRLLCCLAYEHQFYGEQRRLIPQEGTKLSWDGALWKVMEVNVIMGKLKLSTEEGRVAQLPAESFERVDGRWIIKPTA